MGILSFHSGIVSHIVTSSLTSSTTHKISFRVNGKPVFFSKRLNIGDGDHVDLVGQQIGGELKVRAIRNNSTGVEYFEPGSSCLFGSYVLIPSSILPMLGIMLDNDKSARIALLVLIPMLYYGLYLLGEGKINRKALTLLRAGQRGKV